MAMHACRRAYLRLHLRPTPQSKTRKKQADKPPTVILLAGLQGAGKTTAAAKLALYCQSRAEKAGAFEKVRNFAGVWV